MEKLTESIETIKEIRELMVKSSRFISLSGFSGIFIGLFAIMGVLSAYVYFNIPSVAYPYYNLIRGTNAYENQKALCFYIIVPVIVLILSLLAATLLTIRKTTKQSLPVWDITSRQVVLSILLPVFFGALFCIALALNHYFEMIAPATLFFYGFALIHTSKYSLKELNYLGTGEVICGLIAAYLPELGLVLWGIGFGLAHIIYGTLIYYRYER